MYATTYKFTPPYHTIFGEPFIQEQHDDAVDHHLLNASMLEEVLKSLRAALYVRRNG